MKTQEIYVAIAMALTEFQQENLHDSESGIITLNKKESEWSSHQLRITHHP